MDHKKLDLETTFCSRYDGWCVGNEENAALLEEAIMIEEAKMSWSVSRVSVWGSFLFFTNASSEYRHKNVSR